jgi:hypothetical protein
VIIPRREQNRRSSRRLGKFFRVKLSNETDSRNLTALFRVNYLAVLMSSSFDGTSLVTKMPRFILAGSRDQLEIPTKATL